MNQAAFDFADITFAPKPEVHNFRDIEGQRFSRLTVLGHLGAVKKQTRWLCLCECGNRAVVAYAKLVSGKTRSCGCLKREVHANRCRTVFAKHNMSATRTYQSWAAMRTRCANPNDKQFALYGGRGITVRARWSTFENFYSDMGERPEGTTLDRKDVNGNYEPSNCRWGTLLQQNNNKRSTAFVKYRGVDVPLALMCRECGLDYQLIYRRIFKFGWTVDRAIDTPRPNPDLPNRTCGRQII
jgi:hypothetical protein